MASWQHPGSRSRVWQATSPIGRLRILYPFTVPFEVLPISPEMGGEAKILYVIGDLRKLRPTYEACPFANAEKATITTKNLPLSNRSGRPPTVELRPTGDRRGGDRPCDQVVTTDW